MFTVGQTVRFGSLSGKIVEISGDSYIIEVDKKFEAHTRQSILIWARETLIAQGLINPLKPQNISWESVEKLSPAVYKKMEDMVVKEKYHRYAREYLEIFNP